MLEIILVALFGLVGFLALLLFLNAVFNKKIIGNNSPIIFDIGKYLLVVLLITLSIKCESIIGVIIFSLAGVGVVYLGTKGK